MLANKQFTDKLHNMENSEREKNSNKFLNANKYDRIMRSLSIKREPNRAVRKANVNIVQNFDETKLYIPPSATASPSATTPTTSTAAAAAEATTSSNEVPVNIEVNGKNDAKQNVVPNLNDPDNMAEVNINELINTIVDCLQDGCANWFKRATHKDTLHATSEDEPFPKFLRDLIPKALNYVEFNLKRTNNYINEFETILKMSQFAQENELLHNNEVSIKSTTADNRQVQTPSPIQILEPPKEKDHHSRFSIKRSKSLKAPKNTANSSNTLKPEPKPALNNGQSEPELSINVSQTPFFSVQSRQDPLSMIDVMRNHAIQLNFSEIEHDITQISYCLNVLNRFWSKVNHKPEAASFDTYLNSFYQNYCANNANGCFSKLENYLFNINWKITCKNHASTASDDYENEALNSELSTISLTPTSQACALNINFLTSYYKLINYDFITFKLFARQLQLIQLAAILCQTTIRIFNYYHSNMHNGGGYGSGAAGISKDCLIFPSSQYKPISWSNTHVTLYNNQKSPNSTLKLPTMTDNQSNLNQSNQNLDSSINHDQENDESNKIINEFFIDELKDFIHNSIVRLNNQSDIINNIGYFYIVNKSNGLVLEAIDLPDSKTDNNNINSNNNNNTSKLASKSKCPRFYLTQKQKNKNEQLWYYYLYNGCIANKIVRSGHCMAASSLNPKSPVCLWPNVRTTNCKWFFNYSDQTIFSGLTENLVLDYLVKDDDNGQHLVVVNKKELNKQSQKWTIEFF